MSNSDLNKKQAVWGFKPRTFYIHCPPRKVCVLPITQREKVEVLEDVQSPDSLSFPLSASICPLTWMACLAISRTFFEPPGMPLSWDILPLYFRLVPDSGEPSFWSSLEGLLGQELALTMFSTHPPILKGYLEFQPIFPSGCCSTVTLDLEEETG